MKSQIIQFRGYICVLVSTASYCTVLFYRYESNESSLSKLWHSMEIFSDSTLVKECQHINASTAGIVEDSTNDGTKALFVAVQTASTYYENVFCLHIFRLDSTDDDKPKVVKLANIPIKTNAFSKISHPVFLPGPSLVWSQEQDFHVCEFQMGEKTFIHLTHKRIMLLKPNDELEKHFLESQKMQVPNYNSPKILLIEKTMIGSLKTVKGYILLLNKKGSNIKNVVDAPMDIFFPAEYEHIVTALKIEIQYLCPKSLKQTAEDKFAFMRQNFVCAATERKQFLVFTNGFVLYCCDISYNTVTEILQVKQYGPYRCRFFLKSDHSICAIKKNAETGLIEVQAKWDGVKDVFFGPFQKIGCDELMIVKALDQERQPKLQVIEDSNNLRIHIEENSIHLKTFNQEMKKRIQIGQAELCTIEKELRDKQSIVETAIKKLQLRGQGSPVASENSNDQRLGLKEVAHWTTVWLNHWVLGWTMGNYSKSIVTTITAEMCIIDQDLDLIQKVYYHPGSGIPDQPTLQSESPLPDQIGPNGKVTVLLAVKLPWLTCTSVPASVIITWVVDGVLQSLTHRCDLHVKDLFENSTDKFKELSIVQQLMSIRVLQRQCKLSIKSQSSSVLGLESILTSSPTKGHFPAFLEYEDLRVFVFRDKDVPLHGVNFEIKVKDSQDAEILINCCSWQDLLLFVQWLYSWLPKDFSLQDASIPEHSTKLKNCLKDELSLILNFFAKKFDTCTVTDSEMDWETCEGQSSKMKELEVELPFEEYKEFRRKLMELEAVTDRLVTEM